MIQVGYIYQAIENGPTTIADSSNVLQFAVSRLLPLSEWESCSGQGRKLSVTWLKTMILPTDGSLPVISILINCLAKI